MNKQRCQNWQVIEHLSYAMMTMSVTIRWPTEIKSAMQSESIDLIWGVTEGKSISGLPSLSSNPPQLIKSVFVNIEQKSATDASLSAEFWFQDNFKRQNQHQHRQHHSKLGILMSVLCAWHPAINMTPNNDDMKPLKSLQSQLINLVIA